MSFVRALHGINFKDTKILQIWQFPIRTPWVQFFDFLLLLEEKLKMTFWANLIKSPKTKRCCFVDLFWVGVMLTTGFVVWFFKWTCGQHYLAPKQLEPKTKRFVLGVFARFCQNVIFNCSTRSRRKPKRRKPKSRRKPKENQRFGLVGFWQETVILLCLCNLCLYLISACVTLRKSTQT